MSELSDADVLLSSMFPSEAQVSESGRVEKLIFPNVHISIDPLSVSHPDWTRRETEAHNQTLQAHLSVSLDLDLLSTVLFCQETFHIPAPAPAPSLEPPAAPAPIHRTWLWFIGFYTKSIITLFCTSALTHSLTGLLVPGKPSIAVLEGTRKDTERFLVHTRTVLFSQVPPSSRKMSVTVCEEGVDRVGSGFECVELFQVVGHNRSDMVDLGRLRVYLEEVGLGHMWGKGILL
jgi:hypothetical protein